MTDFFSLLVEIPIKNNGTIENKVNLNQEIKGIEILSFPYILIKTTSLILNSLFSMFVNIVNLYLGILKFVVKKVF